ncbi:hypothetical protein QDY71_05640 [Kingella negevensis]|uniref:Uncharacterized protein n=1 Tax=Kingella negevensis TaxID=1522312 RepID=A0A238HJG9_9NEIS|nr:hypothetical protein [Kingella negevensis]MDK4679400.1 hypothetical protein [Kingella negevensis]MDK4682882.1 hypothetical protein [Kingella negevensis]MDK4685205.1 hypothetical protein [Kingella negevensis]MDK4691079.1 hypothetical protein [Kingella negevensis]MDK4693774.1 hypothetical protein [Kingella negevensis]
MFHFASWIFRPNARIQGENASKVAYLARIFNVAVAHLGGKDIVIMEYQRALI